MAQCGYSIVTAAATALTANVARSILGAKAHANSGLQVKGFSVAFDGVTSSAVPVLVELCYCTWATNPPGFGSPEASAQAAPVQTYGRVIAAGFTGGRAWTAEPTVLTVIKELLLAADKGLLAFQYPLGLEPDCAVSEGFVLRCTAPAAVNVRGTMDLERI